MSLSLEEISESPDIVLPFQSSNSLRSIEYDPFRDVIYFIEGSSKISSMKSDASQVSRSIGKCLNSILLNKILLGGFTVEIKIIKMDN